MRQLRFRIVNTKCYRCGVQMRVRQRRDVTDKCSWYCPQCKTQKSVRDGSFFAKSRITLKQWLQLLYVWSREYPIKDAKEEASVSHKTAVDVYQWLREVCSTFLLSDPMKLGGPGIVVQVDESQFSHKPKVHSARV